MSSPINRDLLQKYVRYDLRNSTWTSGLPEQMPGDILNFAIRCQVKDVNKKADNGSRNPEHVANAYANWRGIQCSLSFLNLDGCKDLVRRVRDLMAFWLPPITDEVLEDIRDLCFFGPGTHFSAKRPHEKSLQYKLGGPQTCAFNTRQLLPLLLPENWVRRMGDLPINYVRGNRIAHVPKDVKRVRQIAVEPSLNVYVQKGIGSYLTKVLRERGIADLETGQQKHRALVQEKWSSIATIDLKDASDRLSCTLIKAILPSDWYALLNAARCIMTYAGDYKSWVLTETFSSQGNAFTFPLETMVFKAIALSVVPTHSWDGVSVYGDDIIVPIDHGFGVIDALEKLGFVINVEKSFLGVHHGILRDFRESCGCDTIRGFDVRPVFYRKDAACEGDFYALINRLYEKWGFLPMTHTYLLSCCSHMLGDPRKLLTGPRHYTTTMEHDPERNHVSSDYNTYVWFDVVEDALIYLGDSDDATYRRPCLPIGKVWGEEQIWTESIARTWLRAILQEVKPPKTEYIEEFQAYMLHVIYYTESVKKISRAQRLSDAVREYVFIVTGRSSSVDSLPLDRKSVV